MGWVEVFHIEMRACTRGGGHLVALRLSTGYCTKILCAAMPRRAFRPLQVVTLDGTSEMNSERIEQRELGWDRHDA